MKHALLILTISFGGCASGNLAQDIDPGMTKAEVRAQLGGPKDRSFRGTSEAWQYCKTGATTDYFAVVWFQKGVVTGLTTERSTQPSISCGSVLPAIDWGQMPKPELNINIKN